MKKLRLRNIIKLAQGHGFLPTPPYLRKEVRIVTSFLRYDHVSNSCRLSPREEASRSPFQRFTLDRDGQIIRLEKERQDCLVKGQLDCV